MKSGEAEQKVIEEGGLALIAVAQPPLEPCQAVMQIETNGGPITAEFSRDGAFPAIHVLINGQIAAIVERLTEEGEFAIRAYSQEADTINYSTGAERPT